MFTRCCFALLTLFCVTACAPASSTNVEPDVIAALESFYSAMKEGDAAKAMTLIAPDAVFVESGQLETRAEYEKNHLPADIGFFEKQVTGERGQWQVKNEGDTAWAIVTTEYEHLRRQSRQLYQRATRRADARRQSLADPLDPLVITPPLSTYADIGSPHIVDDD